MAHPDRSSPSAQEPPWFVTTHWTMVCHAQNGDLTAAREALEKLCQIYWAPVHAYIRRAGRTSNDADDLTQQFFLKFLQKEQYRNADRNRGRFRSFLLTSVKHFLINDWERTSAQKRGGGQVPVSLDQCSADDGRPVLEIPDERTAEQAYERAWATTLLDEVRAQLASEFEAEGKREKFELLEQFLPGAESELTYAEVARRLGVAEGTIKSDVHRLKRRYRELLRREIAHTVATPAEIDEELRHLIEVWSRPRG